VKLVGTGRPAFSASAFVSGKRIDRCSWKRIEPLTESGATLSIVSVIPVHPGRVPIDPWDDKPTHDQQLAEARQLAAEQGVTVEILEPAGDPADAIERVARMGNFDTIVIGSRGLGAISRFFQGSVSEHVATHATATVVVAR